MNYDRQQRIARTIHMELQRQAEIGTADPGGAPRDAGATIDIDALAQAIDRLLEGGGAPGEAPLEGPRPAELNASNDG